MRHGDAVALRQGHSVSIDIEADVSWLEALLRVFGVPVKTATVLVISSDRTYISAGGHPTTILRFEDGPERTRTVAAGEGKSQAISGGP